MELRYYYRILARYRWTVLISVLLCTGLMGALVLVKGPLYEASAVIREQSMSMGSSQVFNVQDHQGQTGQTRERIANLASVATGPEVMARTRKRLRLANTDPTWEVTAEPVGWSELLKVSVRSPKENKLPAAANTLVTELGSYWRELNVAEIRGRREFVEKGLTQAKADYRRAQSELVRFKQKAGIATVDTETKSQLEQLAKVKADLTTAAVDVAQLRAKDSAWNSQLSGLLHTRAVEETLAADPMVARWRQQLADDEANLASLRLKYTDQHLAVREAARKVEQTKEELQKQTSTAMGKLTGRLSGVPSTMSDNYIAVQTEYAAARARQQALSQVAGSAEKQFSGLVERESTLASLLLARDSSMNAYSQFQSKLAQMVAQEREIEGSSPIQIVEGASGSISVSRTPQKLLLSLALGLMLGMGLAVLLHYLDNTIQDIDDARRLELPVQAVIPISACPLGVLGGGSPTDGAIEPYEHLRANLFHGNRFVGGSALGGSALMVTAAAPGAGKSTVSANLAMTLARDGHRVLLVDADLRRPRQHLNFGVPNKPGLTEVLQGTVALSKAVRSTAVKNLTVLPAGSTPESPSGMLSSPPVRDAIAAMRGMAEIVVFDTAPGGAFADAAFLATHVRNVLLVVAPGESQREVERSFAEQLTNMGANVAGVVINKTRGEHMQGYYAYSYYGGRRAATGAEMAAAAVTSPPQVFSVGLEEDDSPDSAESS
jgi:capsular exopolysaccharide synthesis family protein